jgi:hypothetical protein
MSDLISPGHTDLLFIANPVVRKVGDDLWIFFLIFQCEGSPGVLKLGLCYSVDYYLPYNL